MTVSGEPFWRGGACSGELLILSVGVCIPNKIIKICTLRDGPSGPGCQSLDADGFALWTVVNAHPGITDTVVHC